MPTPETRARADIDAALDKAGWAVQDRYAVNLAAARGVAVREVPLKPGHGVADYLLFVDGLAVGVIEAKRVGTTLTGVEPQTAKYGAGLPDYLDTLVKPLPFLYQSTSIETRFTNGLDPEPRSRRVFSFHRPETLAAWISGTPPAQAAVASPILRAAEDPARYQAVTTLRARLQKMPRLDPGRLWPAQEQAVRNLERSLADDRPRALIQMTMGSGKTYTAITAIYRLIKYADAQRILFLVDRANLGTQAKKEFDAYVPPDDRRTFTQLYNVQHLKTNRIDPTARVVITTIQRLYSILKGEPELDPSLEEGSHFDTASGLVPEPVPVVYNPDVPIETFDFIVIDECHRSIYNLWRQVLEYFDAYLIGLTATPSKQTFGFFNQNLVMEYSYPQAVADGVNVDHDIYRIRTRITESGSTIEAGMYVEKRDRLTRAARWEQLDEDLAYDAADLDRAVVAPDQIRTVIRTFRDRLFTEIFPGRSHVPKTLIYAKDDAHAEEIVQIVREEFGKGNDFCQKITYKTTGVRPEDLIQSFRISYNPRIAVTVDMIATGTDIKPIEIVMFMRAVKSRTFFEQMKGRGVRVIDETEFKAVTPDAERKTRFVLIDCVGVTERMLSDSPPLERAPTVSFETLLQRVAFGSLDRDLLSSLASRLARLDRQLGAPDKARLAECAGGHTLQDIARGIIDALDPDRQVEAARTMFGLPPGEDPTPEQLEQATRELLRQAAAPIATNPDLREQLVSLRRHYEQTIDVVSKDSLLEAGFDAQARERARELTTSFEQFIIEHKDEITALQVLYSRPYGQRLRFADIKALADAIQAPPRQWTTDRLWQAYETLDKSRVRGSGMRRLTDVVSLVRFALHQEEELIPFEEQVEARFDAWLAQQAALGREFTEEQRRWLEWIRDHIVASYTIELDAFDYAPFAQHGGLGRFYQLFGSDWRTLLDELNEVLAA
ncbi:type I restriction-modification enzyme R subunit C-terminal domain-containing protein [Sphaerobacter thermophilus]|uniref:Type III restriction protein res subunit n=1 Tax=Sphaerobacter thermophilus (strain ATCC 49802 / DSM 20745 / KCCM 41009 / NCIMB 13125 / S 6022) TaxID=479434 RepID=D1C5W5_SPHTD|nr:type I restriction-modification enzyme R subunit C-terminal domain-containing protein [Sphaerobacter thermophilus]ACZ39517.1 type III restriction protein res subunit [Sphaerobacter thermophilus DSM 20745]